AAQLGISKTNADALFTSLKQVAGDYAANVKIGVSGGGTVSVSEQVIMSEIANSPSVQLAAQEAAQGKAAGGYIVRGSGPTGKDSVHALLAPGELVIPTGHAAKYGAMAKADGIPGFAAGGFVTGNPNSGAASATVAKYREPAYALSIATSTGNAAKAAMHFAAGGLVPGFADGGMISQPVFGSVNSMPYSFGENGQPAQVIPVTTGANGQQMQPFTQTQGMQLLRQNAQIIRLLQQQPQTIGQALNNGFGAGARRAFWNTGG
ncbi:MAG TPA: hypothetical protein VMB21_15360, partial [Candidatus Limnocylindria bacterium]|nr:hypothetical protein [Candidatus Limnocylindria bacterium]